MAATAVGVDKRRSALRNRDATRWARTHTVNAFPASYSTYLAQRGAVWALQRWKRAETNGFATAKHAHGQPHATYDANRQCTNVKIANGSGSVQERVSYLAAANPLRALAGATNGALDERIVQRISTPLLYQISNCYCCHVA